MLVRTLTIGAKLSRIARNLLTNSPEKGPQHVIGDDGPQAMRHNDDAIILAAAVQHLECVDRLLANFAPHRDIAGRIAKITRGVANERCKKGSVQREIDAERGPLRTSSNNHSSTAGAFVSVIKWDQ